MSYGMTPRSSQYFEANPSWVPKYNKETNNADINDERRITQKIKNDAPIAIGPRDYVWQSLPIIQSPEMDKNQKLTTLDELGYWMNNPPSSYLTWDELEAVTPNNERNKTYEHMPYTSKTSPTYGQFLSALKSIVGNGPLGKK